MLKKLVLIAAAACLAGAAFAYSSLEELMSDMSKKQVEALKEYIAANPNAEDLDQARSQLVYGLVSQDDYAGAIVLLEAQYEALPDNKKDLDLSVAFGEVVVPLIQLYRMNGQEDQGVAFIAQVREDFSEHAMAETVNQALDEFSRSFDLPGVGDPLDITFTAIDGREIDLADMKGTVVLVDFWATWCVPCIKAMPDLKKVYDEFGGKGFEIVGISLDSEKQKLEDYLKKESIGWPQYFDGQGWDNELARKFGIESIPSTFLIGKDGAIAAVDPSAANLRDAVAALIADQPLPEVVVDEENEVEMKADVEVEIDEPAVDAPAAP